MHGTHTLRPKVSSLLLGLVFIAMIPAVTTGQENDILEPADPISSADVASVPVYEYVLEGRADPFVPFISAKATTPTLDPNEILEEEIDLTGMRQFEPGQLTLVAVLETTNKKIAMVEDVTGKGYPLKKGDAIGRRGTVTQINLQQVLITETAHTRAGKEVKNTIVMRLKKEGEQ